MFTSPMKILSYHTKNTKSRRVKKMKKNIKILENIFDSF